MGYIIPEISNEVQNPIHYFRIKSMEFLGVDPAIIYAFRKTDMIINPYYRGMYSEEERKAWDDAIVEFQHANQRNTIGWETCPRG